MCFASVFMASGPQTLAPALALQPRAPDVETQSLLGVLTRGLTYSATALNSADVSRFRFLFSVPGFKPACSHRFGAPGTVALWVGYVRADGAGWADSWIYVLWASSAQHIPESDTRASE